MQKTITMHRSPRQKVFLATVLLAGGIVAGSSVGRSNSHQAQVAAVPLAVDLAADWGQVTAHAEQPPREANPGEELTSNAPPKDRNAAESIAADSNALVSSRERDLPLAWSHAARALTDTQPPPLPDRLRPRPPVLTSPLMPVSPLATSGEAAVVPQRPVFAGPSGAAHEQPAEEIPRQHILRDGDSLAKLAQRYLGDAARAGELYALNRQVLDDPELLPIGVVIELPPRPR